MVFNKAEIERTLQHAKEIKKRLVKLQKVMPQIMRTFLERVANQIIGLANSYVESSEIGSTVKSDIINGWQISFSGTNAITITNKAEKAAYVEFGVGIVGEEAPDPVSPLKPFRWEYNVPSLSKNDDFSWTFPSDTDKMNIPNKDLIESNYFWGQRGDNNFRGYFCTKGTEGVFFMFNALTDIYTNQREHIKYLFNETVKEYMGR